MDPGYVPAAAEAVFAHANLLTNRLSQDPEAQLREAERLAALAMALQPESSLSLAAQAAVLRQRRRFAEALVFYERAAEGRNEFPSRASIGFMRILLGEPGTAEEPIRAALAASPSHRAAGTWQLWVGLAQLHAGYGDFGAAAFDMPIGRRSIFSEDQRFLHRAAALYHAGQQEAAQDLLRAVVTNRPDLTQRWLRSEGLSGEPGYIAQRERMLLAPLAALGLPE